MTVEVMMICKGVNLGREHNNPVKRSGAQEADKQPDIEPSLPIIITMIMQMMLMMIVTMN